MRTEQPTYAEQMEIVSKLKRLGREQLGLGPDSLAMRHLDRLAFHWDPMLLAQVQTCFRRLEAARAALDNVGDRIPPGDVFAAGGIAVGEARGLRGGDIPVFLAEEALEQHLLISGISGAGKTNFARVLMRRLAGISPTTRFLMFDPNASYASLCHECPDILRVPWYELRLNPFVAPVGYPYKLWMARQVALLGEGELLHSRYLIQKRLDGLFERFGVPLRDDGRCRVPSLPDLLDDLVSKRERPGSRDEGYRAAASNVLDGRIRSSGDVYECWRGQESRLSDARVCLDTAGLEPEESLEYFQNVLIEYLYAHRSLLAEGGALPSRIVVLIEEAQAHLAKGSGDRLKRWVKILLRSRSLGIGFIFIVQDLAAVDPMIFSAANTHAVFRQGSSSSKLMAKRVLDLTEREKEMLSTLQDGECFLRMAGHEAWPHPFVMKVPLA